MSKKSASFNSCFQPKSKVLISCRGLNGENNALAVAYCCQCSYDPPMVMAGIVPSRYSYKLIKESGCFVVNLVGEDNRALFDYLGSHSGRDEDKLKAAGAKLGEAVTIKAPLLEDCPVNAECKIVDSIITGSHHMFVGKVEYVHADEEMVKENGEVDFSTMKFL